MDSNLNYQAHVDVTTRKCTGILISLNHARHVIPKNAIRPIIEGLVISILRYGLSVYGTCGQVQLNRVQKLINFCARVVSGRRRYDHVTDVLNDLKWMTAIELSQYHRLCLLHRVINTELPKVLYDTVGVTGAQRHTHATRAACAITLPQIKSEAGRKRISYSAVLAYNRLPFTPRAMSFRRQLRKHLSRHDDAD